MTEHTLPETQIGSEDGDRETDAVLQSLADHRRRAALTQLLAARGSTPVDILATRVAAAETGGKPVDDEHRRDVALDLRHVHLPHLDAVGLIDLSDDGAIATERAARFERALGLADGVADPDAAIDALADHRRRAVLRHAAGNDGAIDLDTLATRIAAESGVDRDAAALELHHCHLPKLDDAGFLAYDADDHRVDGVDAFPVDATLRDLIDWTGRDTTRSADGSPDGLRNIPL